MHLKSPSPLHPSCLVLILHLHHCLPSNYMFALVHICTHMYRYVYNNCIYTHTHIQLYVRVHVRARLYVCESACLCAHIMRSENISELGSNFISFSPLKSYFSIGLRFHTLY